MMLNPQLINEYTDPKILNEAKGIPDIIKYLVPFVSDEIIEEYNTGKKDFKLKLSQADLGLNDLYFKYLNIDFKIEDNPYGGAYNYTNSAWDNKKKIFNTVEINLSISKDMFNQLNSLLAHELLHSYEDFKTRMSDKGFLNRTPNQLTPDASNLLPIEEKYQDHPKIQSLIQSIYYLMSVEKRANVASVYHDLENYNFTLDSYNNNKTSLRMYYIYDNILNQAPKIVDSLNDYELDGIREYIQQSSIAYVGNNKKDNNRFKNDFKKYLVDNSGYCLKKIDNIVNYYLDENFVNKFENRNLRGFKLLSEIDRFKEINENIEKIN